jgi:excisionase family DNA binding protein
MKLRLTLSKTAHPASVVRLAAAETSHMETTESTSNTLEPRIGRSVSLDHAAQILGVSRRTIYNRIREGRLQTIRTLGGSQRVLLDSVQDTGART